MKKILITLAAGLLFQASTLFAFELDGFDGSTIKLEDKIGKDKWTLVMFWAHDCHVCKEEFPLLSDFHKSRDDVDVIGISIDGQSRKSLAQAFLDKTQPSFPTYLSDISLVAVNYQVLTEEGFRGTPTFLLFKPDGTLIGNNPGKLPITALENFIDSNS